jgi:hypothetical protein
MAGSQPAAETRNGEAVTRGGHRRRRFFVLSSLAVGAALSACSTPVAPPVAGAPVAAADIPAPPAPLPAPAEPAVMRVPELPVLTGMDPAQLTALLGEPDLRRSEPPAELWQYRSADCVLDVFLYVDSTGYHVMRSETRNRHVAPPLIINCSAPFHRQSRGSRL